MSIIYGSDNLKSDFNPSLIYRMNPNSQWANHSYNYIVLEHVSRSSTNFSEKQQARKEMEIAQRKMTFWERHPDYEENLAIGWRKKLYRM